MSAAAARKIGSSLFILVVWQVLVQTGKLNELFLPAPLSVLRAMWQMILSGVLPWAVLVSLNRLMQGFVYGSLIGIVLGLVAGSIRWVEDVVDPCGSPPSIRSRSRRSFRCSSCGSGLAIPRRSSPSRSACRSSSSSTP